jgi:hypothetical protein
LPNVISSPSPTPVGGVSFPTGLQNFEFTNNDTGTVILTGADAAVIYRLLSVTPAQVSQATATTYIKQGNQFACTHAAGYAYTCKFVVTYVDGSIAEQLPLSQVSTFDSEATQVAATSDFLQVSDPSVGKKVKLSVKGLQAEMLYGVLKATTYTLAANDTFDTGSRREGTGVDCWVQKKKTEEKSTTTCYLNLDLAAGSVDKVKN